MSNRSWLAFRGFVVLLFIGHFIAHLNEYWGEEHWMYFIYLTRWTLTTEVIQEILYFLASFWGYILLENGIRATYVPAIVKVHMAFKCMVLPTCLLSSGLYWALSPYLPPPYVSAACHGGDVIVIHLSFFLGRWPYAWNKIGWVLVYGGTYGTWTLLDYLLKIGTDDSAPCEEYPLNECPIYKQIDWHHPLVTGLLMLGGALVGPPLLGGLYTWLTKLRDGCDGEAKVMREAVLVPTEEKIEEPKADFKCGTKSLLNCGA
ncbi:unnamed protein product [Effrenium voratum]|nr:unnamed protein product [Effrenium voratum]